jgi:membrane protein insertase Oxa1/YidC/SpoIIIJ
LIDWGWFYFITKPMFLALDWFYHLVGNFGVAILLVTVLVNCCSSRSPTSPMRRWPR